MGFRIAGLALAAGLALGQGAAATPVDLTGWLAEGSGAWALENGTDTVRQTINGQPTVFHDNSGSSQGRMLSGTIEVDTTADDDFIGFVLGYDAGDLGRADADYLLIDWKQADQTISGFSADAGLSISRVTGVAGASDFWSHGGNVTELARATSLGSTGWQDETAYSFDLVFTATRVEVFVDGVREIGLNGSFSDGGFGFYNLSQGDVIYAGITEAPAVVPLPATLPLLLGAVCVAAGVARRRAA